MFSIYNPLFCSGHCQDHLESYFSLVRASLGANNNPNKSQFQSAYRKLLFCCPHISGNTNCSLEFPNALLEVSSASRSLAQSSIDTVIRAKELEILLDYDTLVNSELDPYEQHLSAIVASNIEKEVLKSIKVRSVSACQGCLNIFNENLKCNDNLIQKKMNRGQRISY